MIYNQYIWSGYTTHKLELQRDQMLLSSASYIMSSFNKDLDT